LLKKKNKGVKKTTSVWQWKKGSVLEAVDANTYYLDSI